MTLSGTTALIFALGVWMTPPPARISASAAVIGKLPDAAVEAARQRRYPKCTRVKRAPCEMLRPEEESSETV